MNTLPFKTHKSLKTYYWSMLSWIYKHLISKIFWRDIADDIALAWNAGYDCSEQWYEKNAMKTFNELKDLAEDEFTYALDEAFDNLCK